MNHPIFNSLDHLAFIVEDTGEALKIWRDRVGLEVLFSEVVNEGTIRLTHLDLGNTHLQLVEPLTEDHPLKQWLAKNGPGFHHLCFETDNVDMAFADLPAQGLPTSHAIHQGTRGKRALFLDSEPTDGFVIEVTGR